MGSGAGERSLRLVRAVLRQRGEVTRPELAEATGLSLVTVGRLVRCLCENGELESLGESRAEGIAGSGSGGGAGRGRPAERYRYRGDFEWTALFIARPDGSAVNGRLEWLNRLGVPQRCEEGRFAMLHKQSLDAWIDAEARRRRLGGICLALPPPLAPAAALLSAHLQRRYACPVRCVSMAMALADESDESVTLCLPPGGCPEACLRSGGHLRACGSLFLLPMPAEWEGLDSSDHTLFEEMVSRLILMLSCTLAPMRLAVHAACWTERLVSRIRYNVSTKHRHTRVPQIVFRPLSERLVTEALRRLSLQD